MASYTVLSPSQAQAVADTYALGAVTCEPLAGGMANSSFLLTQQATGRRLVLTVLDHHDADSARRLVGVMTHLADHGIATPRPLASRSGDRLGQVQGTPIICRPFIDGAVAGPIAPADLRLVGGALAQVHDVPPPAGIQLLPRRIPSEPSGWIASAPDVLRDLVEDVVDLPQLWSECACVLGHGDLFADNVLMTDAGPQLIDWEESCADAAIVDVAMAIVGTCRDGGRIDPRKCAALLDGYRSVRRLEGVAVLQDAMVYACAILAVERYLRHGLIWPDPTQAQSWQEMVDLSEALRDARGPATRRGGSVP